MDSIGLELETKVEKKKMLNDVSCEYKMLPVTFKIE